MIKATKKFVLATLLLAGFGSAAIADTKEEPAASASFSAYREVKEYAEKYVCEKPTDETANQCAIAENATHSFYQTDVCKAVDEDGACDLSSVSAEDASKLVSCSTSSHRECSRMPDGGRYCWSVTCTTCCRPTFPFLSCATVCGPVLR